MMFWCCLFVGVFLELEIIEIHDQDWIIVPNCESVQNKYAQEIMCWWILNYADVSEIIFKQNKTKGTNQIQWHIFHVEFPATIFPFASENVDHMVHQFIFS